MFVEALVCLALNVYHEARDQPFSGQVAVAQVVMNRVKDNRYPDNVCDVVTQGPTRPSWRDGTPVPVRHMCQFSWYCDGKKDVPEDSKTWEESIRLAQMVLDEGMYDFTHGASHYHNDTVHPYWADHLYKTLTIDNHIFYK